MDEYKHCVCRAGCTFWLDLNRSSTSSPAWTRTDDGVEPGLRQLALLNINKVDLPRRCPRSPHETKPPGGNLWSSKRVVLWRWTQRAGGVLVCLAIRPGRYLQDGVWNRCFYVTYVGRVKCTFKGCFYVNDQCSSRGNGTWEM